MKKYKYTPVTKGYRGILKISDSSHIHPVKVRGRYAFLLRDEEIIGDPFHKVLCKCYKTFSDVVERHKGGFVGYFQCEEKNLYILRELKKTKKKNNYY